MASTKVRRGSIMSHRQRPSIHNSISLNDYPVTPSLPPPVTLHPFVLPADSKHALLPLSVFSPTLVSAARRSRIRPSLIALLTLLTLATFCVLHQHLNDGPSLSFPIPSQQPWQHANDYAKHRTALGRPPRPPKIALAPDEELAAVVAFIAALPSNALPNSIDPMKSVDPDLVLDFDTRTPKAAHEVRELVEDTWMRLPVVLLSKVRRDPRLITLSLLMFCSALTQRHSPTARQIKVFLTEYNLNPSPIVFEVDERGM